MSNFDRNFEDSLMQNKKRILSTRNNDMPDEKRFRISQMLFGMITEYYEIEHELHRLEEIGSMNETLGEQFKMVLEHKMEEVTLEIGDLWWYIINFHDLLKMENSLIEIVEEVKGNEDFMGISPHDTEYATKKVLDSIKKYLFQLHDFEEYEDDFEYLMKMMIAFSIIILKDLERLSKMIEFNKKYNIGGAIDAVADKLEERYDGEFSKEKSMQREE